MKKIFILIPVFFLVACSVQKRKYRDGYYVSHQQQADKGNTTNNPQVKNSTLASANNQETQSVETVTLAAETETYIAANNPDSCDVVVMRNGNETAAKVLEITAEEVKYKKCDMPDGPLYVVRKDEVFMLKYANGTNEIFSSEPSTQQQVIKDYRQNKQKRVLHPDTVWSFILGLLGLFWWFGGFSIRAVIIGIDTLRDIRQNPLAYKGEGFAIAGIILGGIKLLVLLALIVMLILAM